MTAGYETLKQLTPELFAEIEEKTNYLCDGLRSLADKYSMDDRCSRALRRLPRPPRRGRGSGS